MSSQPFYKTDRELVWKFFGKNEKTVNVEVNVIKRWLETQKHLPETPSDSMIQYFLTICQFSIERTKQCLDMYYAIRTVMPEYFEQTNPTSCHMSATYDICALCPLPTLTNNLERVFFVKLYPRDTELLDLNKIIAAAFFNMNEVRLCEDLAVMDKFLADFEEFKMSYIPKFTPTHLKKIAFIFEELWNKQVKEIHFFNMPKYAEKIVYLCRTFLNKELREKIFVHNSIEEVYKVIPREILPKDYGGDEKCLDELNKEWLQKLKEYRNRFESLENFKVDDSLRIPYGKNCNILGYYGNYMKTETD
ncbi:alpha-tocopherol transfer protein-like [Diabrotica virgifera virgifera]|uniref:CRAL-TRIO domain-containing protein n=1 Tax=Diabrotica virgifera virgifera TaxID=50390 RepID=A0ABM5KPF6_DIAVI|nr:alpha-tocopherol transfer protein-like [Diabrotica virgifera virgifera]